LFQTKLAVQTNYFCTTFLGCTTIKKMTVATDCKTSYLENAFPIHFAMCL